MMFPFISGRLRGLVALVAFSVSLNAADTGKYSVFNPHPDLSKTADGSWTLHDMDRPAPPRVEPKTEAELTESAKASEGAFILFDGNNLDAWNVPQPWLVENGFIRVRPVNLSLQSKQAFGSCHLHLEWKTQPGQPQKTGQNRGNSGVFLMSTYEIQILDTYENKTYADGMAGALYGVKPPEANALRPAGEWQYYDIWFKRPVFGADGKMLSPACVTVMINGVIVQSNVPFDGPSSYKKRSLYKAHSDALPLLLQNHNETVDFRNIWIQPLADDAVISPAGPVGINK
jgi:hypothetical protein